VILVLFNLPAALSLSIVLITNLTSSDPMKPTSFHLNWVADVGQVT